MKRFINVMSFLILLLQCFQNSYAQPADNSISGYVKDADTGERLAGVNVYLSGTYWGASTNTNGFYEIKSIVPGGYEIVASMVGYSHKIRKITVKENNSTEQNFFIELKSYEIQAIEVAADLPDEWYNQLELFRKYIFGRNVFAKHCVIENKYQINFYEDENSFTASCPNPVLVTNNILGYKISCMLDYFRLNKNENSCSYYVYTKFEKLEEDDEKDTRLYGYSRNKAYYGSINHFLKSLITGKCDEEWFDMTLYENPRKSIKKRRHISRDQILRCVRETQIYYLDFEGYLSIQYEYPGKSKLPESWLFLKRDFTKVDKHGYIDDPNTCLVYGYWAQDGIANMLPKYFEPCN